MAGVVGSGGAEAGAGGAAGATMAPGEWRSAAEAAEEAARAVAEALAAAAAAENAMKEAVFLEKQASALQKQEESRIHNMTKPPKKR